MDNPIKLEEVDRQILNILIDNTRIPFTDIAKQLLISPGTVHVRVKKMEDVGIINGYKTIVSSYEVGYQLKAIITIRAFMGKLKPFLTKVKSFDEVLNCYRITGNENIVMEVMLTNQRHLEQFIDQLISYGETKTQIVLSNVIENTAITKTKLYEI